MKRNPLFVAAVISAMLSAGAFAQATLPANAPATLPPGHPAFDDSIDPAMLQALGQADGDATLPAGMAAAASQAAKGSLAVTLVPGTAGIKFSGDEAVTVELYHRNAKIKQYDLHADAQEMVRIADLPIMPPVQAVVTVRHNDLVQQIITPEISSDAPTQNVQMKVYEPTETPPAWKVAMQHMILQWDKEKNALQVTEMISASADGDRAWLGTKTADGRVTMAVPLPAEAQDVELGDGFTEKGCRIADGKLVTGDPLFPGRSEWRFSYTLPIENGEVKLRIASPAAAEKLIVFAPADGALIRVTGLEGGDVVDAGDGKVRMYQAGDLAAGATEELDFSGIALAAPTGAALPDVPQASNGPREVALGGAFLLVLIGGAMLLLKKQPARKSLGKA